MLSDKGFDLWAYAYDEDVRASDEADEYPFAGYGRVLGRIYERVRAGGARRVLDLGIGTGVLSGRLYAEGVDITGVDFSGDMLVIARRSMPRARLIQCDLGKGLPPELAGEKFDFVICTYAIHHFDDARKAALIREALNCLEPGGALLLGDVAFETEAQLGECRARAGEAWDDDEHYIVAGRLAGEFPGMEFERMSHCAGVCAITNDVDGRA